MEDKKKICGIRKAKRYLREFAETGNKNRIDLVNWCIGYYTEAGSVPVEVLDYINNLANEGYIRY